MDDRDIATAISGIFQNLEDLHRKGLPVARGSKVRREAIHFIWELRSGAKLDSSRPHSRAARDYRASGQTVRLRYEHSIPLASCMELLRAASADPNVFLAALQQYIRPVIVLDTESDLLRQKGLNSRLPQGASCDDGFARYRAVGIEIEGAC